MRLVLRTLVAAGGIALAVAVSAQVTVPPLAPGQVLNTAGPIAVFPPQNLAGPVGVAQQTNYPYPGQCLSNPANRWLFPMLPACQTGSATLPGYAPSFNCPSGRTAGGWDACGAATTGSVISTFTELGPNAPPVPPATMFLNDLLNPPAYAPDRVTYPGADYYEIKLHESWGFDILKTIPTARDANGNVTATAFPNPGVAVPNGKQWTGLRCSPTPPATTCTGGVAAGTPLLTPIWGVGSSHNFLDLNAGAPVPQPASTWSANNFLATWPSISIWANKDRPVVVRWVNEFPNQHVFCPHPEAADWPCAIDRTFMGVKARIDPALAAGVPHEGVNQYGSPQQPDNSWVTHLHGGDIPPATDGFAEKWFGNQNTAPLYNQFLNPPFESPLARVLKRPAGNSDVYTYPMMQDEATIWFHDHTLGKTHHNVIAGPAGFFPVTDETRHLPTGDLAWLNRMYPGVNLPAADKDLLGAPKYDLYLAIQDRSFNDDGSINFSNGMGQKIPPVPAPPIGATSVTPGVNPQVHPVWVPEYFGDHALVNGVLWPRKVVDAGWYRLRIVDGSDSRCWTLGFSTIVPAVGTLPKNDVPFFVIANDQGYLKSPVLAPGNQFTMCPGERYEILVNFGGAPVVRGGTVTMTNTAPAPFPAGITPQTNKGPFAAVGYVMQFQVTGTGAGIVTAAGATPFPVGWTVPLAFFNDAALRPAGGAIPVGAIVRQVYLNERADGVTLSPMGMQLNGVPFEYKVTETPKKGSTEYWQFVNLTVDAHPMHPHLVKHLIVSRQLFNVGAYKALLCGSSTCQPGTAPGGEMQVVPDVTPLLLGMPTPVTAASVEGGFKDASQVPPGLVTTIVATWHPGWQSRISATPNAPGTGGVCTAPACDGTNWTYDDVTTGPYVWHCHINSHEDSEMMRTSLVVQ